MTDIDPAAELATEPAGHQNTRPITVTAADQQYDDLVRGLNQRYIGTPEAVKIVTSTAQVVAVVQAAVDQRKRISVRSGGHCFEDFVYNPDVQIVVDMSEMDEVRYDATHNAIAIDSGATLLRAFDTMYKQWGVTIPAGFCYSVGMGGHVSGGGWGTLSRRNGLVVDHLFGVEVVVVDAAGRARAVVATRDERDPNRDLWWAHTGGGGGNFGIVTRYLFRSPGVRSRDPRELLPAPPQEVFVNAIAWPWTDITRDEFIRLAHNYARWHVANSAPDSPTRGLSSFLLLNHRSNGQIGLITQMDADVPDADRILADYLKFMTAGVTQAPGPLTVAMGDHTAMEQFEVQRRLPWLQATRFLGTTNGALNDPTFRAEFKATYMLADFPENQLAALYKHLTRTDIVNPNVGVQLSPYGGRISAVGPTATASVHRTAAFKLLWSAAWNDPADDAKYIGWARESYQEVYAETGGVPVPNTVTDGCYVNYADADLSDSRFNRSSSPWSELYYKENYPRLRQVKKRWDPRNIFRHAQSVELP